MVKLVIAALILIPLVALAGSIWPDAGIEVVFLTVMFMVFPAILYYRESVSANQS